MTAVNMRHYASVWSASELPTQTKEATRRGIDLLLPPHPPPLNLIAAISLFVLKRKVVQYRPSRILGFVTVGIFIGVVI